MSKTQPVEHLESVRIPGGEVTQETVQAIAGMFERGELTVEELGACIGSVGHVSTVDGRITPEVFENLLAMFRYVRQRESGGAGEGRVATSNLF